MFPEQSVRHEKISIHALREEGDTYRLVRLAKFDEFLSTPSARRATTAVRCPLPRFSISIHALREEGDAPLPWSNSSWINFYPRPPRGGRRKGHVLQADRVIFLSTPSARRATRSVFAESIKCTSISIHALREEGDAGAAAFGRCRTRISIHALREEGDQGGASTPSGAQDFYPRPPRGGRPVAVSRQLLTEHFYPRPPRGGRLADVVKQRVDFLISIHALREEGDVQCVINCVQLFEFLSTPSARRATANIGEQAILNKISIHALREEGDPRKSMHRATQRIFLSTPSARRATQGNLCTGQHSGYFYPRPPRGGRRHTSPTGNGREPISIHALREEGDSRSLQWASTLSNFYPRPPRGGRHCVRRSQYSTY